jgi:16S rRNA (guanine966-N2)-methyltransferase
MLVESRASPPGADLCEHAARRVSGREGSLRVIGGFLGSRRLVAPSSGVRPTSDRVREAVFAHLGELSGLRVLDLYAGTGSLGIEAISRGARDVVFVERAAQSLRALNANITSLGIGDRTRVLRGDVCRCVRRLGREGERFDLVFLDPPYASQESERAAAAIVEAKLLAEGATLVFELPKRHSLAPISGLVVGERRSYGDTAIELAVPTQDGISSDPVKREPSRQSRAREERRRMEQHREGGENG